MYLIFFLKYGGPKVTETGPFNLSWYTLSKFPLSAAFTLAITAKLDSNSVMLNSFDNSHIVVADMLGPDDTEMTGAVSQSFAGQKIVDFFSTALSFSFSLCFHSCITFLMSPSFRIRSNLPRCQHGGSQNTGVNMLELLTPVELGM